MEERFSEQGLFSRNELMTTDLAAAKKFYAELLGWEMADMTLKEGMYSVIKAKEYDIGDIMPPRWRPVGCLM